MDITGYADRLRADLGAAAAAGGPEMIAAADRLTTALDAAVRMTLLEALSDAAAEITAALDGATVEVRLRGRDPDLVVAVEASPQPSFDPPAPGGPVVGEPDDGDVAVARITLRLPEPLKQRAEAAASGQRVSLNTWLVDAVRDAADGSPAPRPGRRGRTQLTGWAR